MLATSCCGGRSVAERTRTRPEHPRLEAAYFFSAQLVLLVRLASAVSRPWARRYGSPSDRAALFSPDSALLPGRSAATAPRRFSLPAKDGRRGSRRADLGGTHSLGLLAHLGDNVQNRLHKDLHPLARHRWNRAKCEPPARSLAHRCRKRRVDSAPPRGGRTDSLPR